MEQQFVTVSKAMKLTGKSERTIRRFLQNNTDENEDHFQLEHRNGRDIWLIDTEFLGQRYPLKHAGQTDTMTSGDNDPDKSRDNKVLTQKWQQKKQNAHDNRAISAGQSDTDDRDKGDTIRDGKPDMARDMSGESDQGKLWSLVKDLQRQLEKKEDQISKKDEQLDKYYQSQLDLMKTMGELMQQDNFLLAQSQQANTEPKSTSKNVPKSEVVEREVVEGAVIVAEEKEAEVKTTPVKKSKPKTKNNSQKSKSKGSNKRWWNLFAE